ncbi:MAG: type II toxin-antitoxin system ParD family antitoxin [Gammaproteobacteria bacterium]|nr:type II toxin-antitoxin system ParD family antitoxin [Gammaproteobacteria bacterium]
MPMVKKTYSITETLDQYVGQRIKSGEYATDSEYVRDLIRRDQEENREIAYIRSKLLKAEQSGFINQSKEEMLEEFKAEMRVNGEL